MRIRPIELAGVTEKRRPIGRLFHFSNEAWFWCLHRCDGPAGVVLLNLPVRAAPTIPNRNRGDHPSVLAWTFRWSPTGSWTIAPLQLNRPLR